MIPPATMARLGTLGFTPEQAAAVADMLSEVEAATEAKAGAAIASRRASDRARQQRKRGAIPVTGHNVTSRDVTGHHVMERDPSPSPSLPPGPPNPPTPSPVVIPPEPSAQAPKGAGQKRARDRSAEPEGFADWYAAYPEKVGRLVAAKAFDKVIRAGSVTVAELHDGLERYKRSKPPDRAWRHPATFLNGGHWADEPAEPPLPLVAGQLPPLRSVFGGTASRPTSGSASAMAGILAASNRR